jgi:Family of unknown function (DUF5317)
MFILYGVLIGLLIGVATGGSAALLGRLRFRWGLVVMLGMAAQLLLFSSPIGDALGLAAPAVYMATNGVVLAAVARNLAIPGLPLVLLGGSANLLAMVVNGGYMPVSRAALEAMNRAPGNGGYSNSGLLDHVQLAPLTDVFAMPTWLPVANVFSAGDVLIGIGVSIAIVAGMHGRGPRLDVAPTGPVDPIGAPGH